MKSYLNHLSFSRMAFVLGSLIALASGVLKAQDLSDTTYYKQLENQYHQLLEHPNTVKHALRIKAKILNKLDQHGSMTAYNRAISNICGSFCDGPDLADWQYAGLPEYTSGLIQWNGFVGEVLANPGRINSGTPEGGLCLGTPTSGVFRFNSNAPGWENRTDPLNSPALGISKILRNPADTSHLIATTGTDHTYDHGGGVGLITSNDNGQTWMPWSTGHTSCFDLCDDNLTGIYEHVDYAGDKSNLNHAFYLTVRKQFEDRLCTFCAITGSSSSFFDITPPGWGTKRIADFTANKNGSVLVSTINPWGYGTELWHGEKDGPDCGFINWTNITTNLESAVGGSFLGSMNQFISLSESKNNVVFARTKGVQSNEVYRSTDGGLTWEMRFSNSAIAGRSFRMLEYSDDTKLLYVGSVNLHVWDDQNQNFYTFSNQMHVDVRDIDFSGINSLGEEVSYLAHDGGVSECIYDPNLGLPAGMSFRPISGNSMPIAQLWGIGIAQDHSGNYATGHMHNNSFASVGGTVGKFGAGDGGDIEINPVDNSTVYFSNNTSIRKVDLSSVFSSAGTQIDQTSQWQFGCPLELHPNSPSLLFYGDDKNAGAAAELKVVNDSGAVPNVTSLASVIGNNSGHVMEAIGSIGLTEAKPGQVVLGTRSSSDPARSSKILKIDNFSTTSTWEDLSHRPVTNDGNLPFKDATAWLPVGDIVVSPYDEELFFISMQGTNPMKRVYRTTDGGATFQDYSTGLPYVPVNNLEYLYNSNDLLLAATDAGVYYRDNTMASWVCFNEGHPLVWTTDIDVNYCTDEAWATTHGRGLYKTPLGSLPRVARQLEITDAVIWDKDRVVYSDVVVKPGAQLNINGALVKIAAGKQILVEAGGSLQVLNSELTSLCEDDCWIGITVEGNTNLLQNTANQGFALLNNSTVSHAKSALNAQGLNSDFSQLDWGQMGGYFTCTNVNFLNNRRAIQFQAYENTTTSGSPTDNLSSISDCQFIINDEYVNGCGSNSPFITMNAVDGVLLEGNVFRDDRTGLSNPQNFRSGIGTTDATFKVNSRSSGPNIFDNLYRGIEVANVTEDSPFTLTIEDALFISNETGIKLFNVNNESHLLRNQMSLDHPFGISSYGILLENSSGFVVEENVVQKLSGAIGFTGGFGVASTINPNNPAGTFFGHNVIYNNIALNLSEGFRASGDNVAANNVDGLEFLCNQNIGNAVDFHWMDCIQPQQGSSATPAGNTFSCGSSISFQIGAAAAACVTYHHQQGLSCTGGFSTAYPGIAFSATTSAPGCNYIVGLEERAPFTDQILLYPNPAEERLTIEPLAGQGISTIKVFDLQGKEVTARLRLPLLPREGKCELDVAGLPLGSYLIKGEFEDGTTFVKMFVKQ